jgi:hypothetical protein
VVRRELDHRQPALLELLGRLPERVGVIDHLGQPVAAHAAYLLRTSATAIGRPGDGVITVERACSLSPTQRPRRCGAVALHAYVDADPQRRRCVEFHPAPAAAPIGGGHPALGRVHPRVHVQPPEHGFRQPPRLARQVGVVDPRRRVGRSQPSGSPTAASTSAANQRNRNLSWRMASSPWRASSRPRSYTCQAIESLSKPAVLMDTTIGSRGPAGRS